jgi:hypothetical membrane protein
VSTRVRETSGAIHEERPELLVFSGAVGILGNIAPIVAMALAVPIAQHELIADTISDLGRGPHKWVMDTGFYFNAAGLLALAIGTAHYHVGRAAWSAGVFCLAFLALVITLLGLWDDLATERSEGWTWHVWLTFILGPLYLAGPLLMAPGASRISKSLSAAFIASAVLWTIFATAFKLAPDSYDGLLEKIAVAATLLWTLPLSVILLRRGMR